MSTLIVRREGPSWPGEASDAEALLACLYRARGARWPDEGRYPLSGLLPPTSMLGLAEAAALLCDALEAGRSILVVGDFDVDGATSTVLALEALHICQE